MNGAQYIVNALHQQGVTQVFGYPGGAIMPVYDALYDGGIPHRDPGNGHPDGLSGTRTVCGPGLRSAAPTR